MWLVADAHWPKAHPCCSAWDLTLLCIPYRVLTTLLSKTSPWSHKTQQSSSKSTHASSMAAQQPNIAQMTSLKRSEFSGTREDCLLGTGIWKRPQLLPFYRLGKLEGKKKKLTSLHQQEDAIQSDGSETLGFPLPLSTRLVLIFQSRKKRATEPDPTWLIYSLHKCQSLSPRPLPLCITRVEASLPQHNRWCTCAYVLFAWCLPLAGIHSGSSVFHTSLSQLLSRKMSNSQTEVACHQMHRSQRCKMVLPAWSHTWLCTQQCNFRNNVVFSPVNNQGYAPFS